MRLFFQALAVCESKLFSLISALNVVNPHYKKGCTARRQPREEGKNK